MPEINSPPSRLYSVDVLRGTVMILMALDHVRDYFSNMLWANATDLDVVSPAYFLTRWVTHFCAPVFILLAGVGASLAEDRGKSKPQLAWYLLTRGLWLVWLELTITRISFYFSWDFTVTQGLVIWTIGWSMVVLAGLCFLPRWAVLAFGLALIFEHNIADDITPAIFSRCKWLWVILHDSRDENTFIQLGHGFLLMAPYKIIPWCGVMALGYAMGPVWRMEQSRRRRMLTALGAVTILSFIGIRGVNGYGNPTPWESHPDRPLFIALSFINCDKYPPSLDYLLMTLGPAFIALAVFDCEPGPIARRVTVFGRVPLFFYVLHLPLIHGLACAASYLSYREVLLWLHSPPQFASAPYSYGYSLPVVYCTWILVLLILYLPCIWFAEQKRRDRSGWLSYL
jgi:uncharacterized membrane protein